MKTGVGRNGQMSRSEGRFPANLILDEQAGALLDEQSGICRSSMTASKTQKKYQAGDTSIFHGQASTSYSDHGGASRFFYCAKASKSERNKGLEGMPKKAQGAYGEFAGDGRGRQTEHQPTANHHPTVKPIKLMEYLIKLITPPSGTVLDPFMGSGSTGVAARNLGFEFIGIELSQEYFEIAQKRIEHAKREDASEHDSSVSEQQPR